MSGSSEIHHQWDKPQGSVNLALEAWSEGLVIGALIIMTGITTANMRQGVLLHKLILTEVGQITLPQTILMNLACHRVAGLCFHFL